MLKNTFCHIPGIGEITEKSLWASGLTSWAQVLDLQSHGLSSKRRKMLEPYLEESERALQAKDPKYFAARLSPNLHWRLFAEFRHETAYLDIETTGLEPWDNAITTIALYDGKGISTYVQGENLEDFESDIRKYKVLVTYNGKCFDIPFIEWYFRTKIDQVQIDLRYVLRSLGFSGGLKGCERQLGIDRGDLAGVDGYFAVLLWHEFRQTGNRKILETMLAYNIEDVVNLETLMIEAYNRKIKGTEFERTHLLELTEQPEMPFEPDPEIIRRIKAKFFLY